MIGMTIWVKKWTFRRRGRVCEIDLIQNRKPMG